MLTTLAEEVRPEQCNPDRRRAERFLRGRRCDAPGRSRRDGRQEDGAAARPAGHGGGRRQGQMHLDPQRLQHRPQLVPLRGLAGARAKAPPGRLHLHSRVRAGCLER